VVVTVLVVVVLSKVEFETKLIAVVVEVVTTV
jgi:hypothetical protein